MSLESCAAAPVQTCVSEFPCRQGAPPSLFTLGEICRRLAVPRHKVEWVIGTRGIRPEYQASRCRVFSYASFDRIRRELDRIHAERGF